MTKSTLKEMLQACIKAFTNGLYYKCVTIVIDAPSVIKVTLQIVASLTIVTSL
jgi:hypothetical protein